MGILLIDKRLGSPYSTQLLIIADKTVSDGCHTVKLYQNGVYIGEAYYGGILMPQQ